ncbi:uncharacterized protein LOC105201337 isoform X3 [Solenopsis invicta]|uniref:uncharacterized protein LOC105201337 isoform X2 n=1 Tax=Solenopsis invicta TaxID=13686 RepID=UPI00193EA1A3|nr:uncharacterized protein LOC105201337 isoform X2 [Solenopsis invicta]XP_039309811.1 uncharacterized protein LOC105201337 isoform X3 [Solenopsis invicta]
MSGCNSNTDKCDGKHICFFQLPKNQIMREAWLRKIGKNLKPEAEKYAKVCSLHFSEDSFVVPKKKSKVTEDKRRLHLLKSAVPTLFLTPTENRLDAMVNMDFQIFHREFPFVCNPGISTDKDKNEGNKTDAAPKSCNVIFDGTNEIDSIITTPSVSSKSNPWLDESYRVTCTPPNASPTTESSYTFPRRSLRVKPYVYHRKGSASREYKRRNNKTHSKTNVTPESITNTLKSAVNFTIPTVSNIKKCNNTIQSISEALTYHSYSEENFSSPSKTQLFANPKYISEINISDFSTPKRARKLINFIKEVDQKKCKQIRCLQDQNRKLVKQIATLQRLVSHLKKLISENAPDNVTQKLNILKKIECPIVNEKMETSDKQILIFDHDYVKTFKK